MLLWFLSHGLEVTNYDLKFEFMNKTAIVLAKKVDSKILILRGQKVILDVDLAMLYGVSVKHLNQQIKRNARRFPSDFLFRLSHDEYDNLRSQIVTSSLSHGGRRYLPHAFTEHGAIMAATVLNSKRAVEMSIFVVRAFVRMREAPAMNQQVAAKLAELEARLENHDVEIQELVEAIRELMVPPTANSRRIGFEVPAGSKGRNKALKIRA
jgi:phage regulator Rha-like protein